MIRCEGCNDERCGAPFLSGSECPVFARLEEIADSAETSDALAAKVPGLETEIARLSALVDKRTKSLVEQAKEIWANRRHLRELIDLMGRKRRKKHAARLAEIVEAQELEL